MSVLKTLTEGIVRRDLSKEGAALLESGSNWSLGRTQRRANQEWYGGSLG